MRKDVWIVEVDSHEGYSGISGVFETYEDAKGYADWKRDNDKIITYVSAHDIYAKDWFKNSHLGKTYEYKRTSVTYDGKQLYERME